MWKRLKFSRLFGAGVAVFVAGVVSLGLGVSEYSVENKLTRDGMPTDAKVVEKRETTSSKGKKRRRVLLRYSDANGTEHSQWQTSRALWEKPIGETVPIVYLRSDPGTTRVEGDPKWRVYLATGAILVVIGLAMAGPPILRAGRSVADPAA